MLDASVHMHSRGLMHDLAKAYVCMCARAPWDPCHRLVTPSFAVVFAWTSLPRFGKTNCSGCHESCNIHYELATRAVLLNQKVGKHS
eukprot:1158462-Pelagomonas_calceolata.AAC.1